MYYDNGKGVLISSDSKFYSDPNYGLKKKIFNIKNGVMAICGHVPLRDEFLEDLKKNMDKLNSNESEEIRKMLQITYKELLDSYKKIGFTLQKDEEDFVGIFSLYEENRPQIYEFIDGGMIQRVDEFTIIGAGKENAEKILRDSCLKDISKKQAIELSIYSIIQVAKINLYVDNNPQIALIDEKGFRILNEDENGNFDFHKFSEIKKDMEKLDEYQRKAFNSLWRGNKETKSKLMKILDEYEN